MSADEPSMRAAIEATGLQVTQGLLVVLAVWFLAAILRAIWLSWGSR